MEAPANFYLITILLTVVVTLQILFFIGKSYLEYKKAKQRVDTLKQINREHEEQVNLIFEQIEQNRKNLRDSLNAVSSILKTDYDQADALSTPNEESDNTENTADEQS